QKKYRAKRIYMLFTGIGIDKIQIVTYSASAISGLSNNQIQSIINNFKKANASEAVSVKVSIPTAPIPLAYVSNSSDNSKEDVWFDEDMFFNKVNPSKVNTVTSDNDMY